MTRECHSKTSVIAVLKAHERSILIAELTLLNGVADQTIFR